MLDADLTGPSIPKVFGLQEKAEGCEDGILPALTRDGVQVMSINLLLEDPGDPVVWRGPVIAGTVKQFWTDVIWSDVDFMFVDMPAGDGRRAADRVPVAAGGRHRRRRLAAGACRDDR